MKITVKQLRSVIREEVLREAGKKKASVPNEMNVTAVWMNPAGGLAVVEADGKRYSVTGMDPYLTPSKADVSSWTPVQFQSAILTKDSGAWNVVVDGKPMVFKRDPSFSRHDYR